MDKGNKVKISNDKLYEIESSLGTLSILGEIITTNKSGMIENIRAEAANWMRNNSFEDIRKEDLDMCILIYVNEQRYKFQDVDNITKIVLDALKRDKNNPNNPYLFNDDSRIRRLLVEKRRRTDIKGLETDLLNISFRRHDPKKQMIVRYLDRV